jgi:DNA-binding NarL/FixJ family response regulator
METGRTGGGGDPAVRALVVADMLFASRVRGAADAAGFTVKVARPAALPGLVRETGTRLVLVDLELAGGKGPDAIRAIRSERDLDGVRVVAFSSHMNRAALEAGREAGADRVLARSAFVSQLSGLLSEA